MAYLFEPKLLTVLKEGYSRQQFFRDLGAGIIVGIVALPLAIAFAIASGVSPEKGLITAIVAGFLISALGGSRVQIGGPTGAFVVIVLGVIQVYGINGLIISTIMAGFILIGFGLLRLGTVIKFIPIPLVVGFTSGIALIIFSTQIKDFFGLTLTSVPDDFVGKWNAYFNAFNTLNWYALAVGLGTLLIAVYFKKITTKVPGTFVAIIITTAAVQIFHIPVESIGSKFGAIPFALHLPVIPEISFADIKLCLKPAFTIAMLGAIESLLSALVADGMISGSHRSNTELIGQGIANVFSGLFGGIPATGAIARTATNVKNGGRTPVSGMVHALVLLLIMLFFGKWATLIPLSCLAAILVVVAYNMSEYKSFISIAKGSANDVAVLLTTFLLTVLVDLTLAIEIGIVLAAMLFMRRMAMITQISSITSKFTTERTDTTVDFPEELHIPKGCEVFEINGPFFFGVAYRFKDVLKEIKQPPKILIIRMRNVPVIDSTGIYNLREIIQSFKSQGTKVVLSGVKDDIFEELRKARIVFMVGKKNVLSHINEAVKRSHEIADELKKNSRNLSSIHTGRQSH
jgi:sulfate permease, SulP family